MACNHPKVTQVITETTEIVNRTSSFIMMMVMMMMMKMIIIIVSMRASFSAMLYNNFRTPAI